MIEHNFHFTSDRPIYLQLVEQIELYIISGKIPPGAKLPSVRDFSIQARVNPNTMQRALAELEELKLIYTERTNGKFVTTDVDQIEHHRAIIAETKVDQYLQEMSKLGFDHKAAIKYLKAKGGK